MARRQSKQTFRQLSSISARPVEQQIEQLLAQGHYQKALTKLKQAQKTSNADKISTTEFEILLAWGRNDIEQGNYRKAEKSLRQALELKGKDDSGDIYYWLAKGLLEQEQHTAALELVETAFETKQLPKQHGGCYLKLLVINDQIARVETLVDKKAARFYAPHLHWARGAIALHQKNPTAALKHFKKMGRPASHGDRTTAWTVYAQQQARQFDDAAPRLGLRQSPFGRSTLSPFAPHVDEHPAMARLVLTQLAHTFSHDLSAHVDLKVLAIPQKQAALVLELIRMITQDDDVYGAAHFWLNLPKTTFTAFPLLQDLHDPIMVLAGAAAMTTNEPDYAELFWSRLITTPLNNPQLALHLRQALLANDADQAAIRLTKQLIQWVEAQATWPDSQRRHTLAILHCWIYDHLAKLDKLRQAEKALKPALQLAPDAADVIGRQGLLAAARHQLDSAIPLLTQALKGGCRSAEVYEQLIGCLEKTDDRDTLKEIRRQYGGNFGDVGVEADIPFWIEALTYRFFFMLAEVTANPDRIDPATRALRIFVDAATDTPNQEQRVTLEQTQAAKQWDALLAPLSPAQKVPVLQAIGLVMVLHAKRKKGLAALQSQYQHQLIVCGTEVPEASLANLVYLVVKEKKPNRLISPVAMYLDASAQPHRALAQLQLQARWFITTDVLTPWLDQALGQDPQNPLLLLAKATTYPPKSTDYQRLSEQGFELARRLQDTEALEAYRHEEWLQAQAMTRTVMPDFGRLDRDPTAIDMLKIIQKMAKEAFGEDIPPELLAQMLPELMAEMGMEMPPGMAGEMPIFIGGFDDDAGDDFFGPPPGFKTSKKRKRSKR
ncbi:MAG: tetratricopeptide repeat protein [Cyanobacteria bacterium P01_H01_bin.26]